MAWKSLLTFSIIILLFIKNAFTYYVLVDAHAEECFFERLTPGTKLLLTFEVIEGGFLDIDVKVNKFHLIVFLLFDLFRSLDRIKKKSIVVIENQVAKQHFLLIWMEFIHYVLVIECQL